MRRALIIISIVLIVGLSFCLMRIYDIRKEKFLGKYLPPVAVKSVLKWSDYYDIHFLDTFSMIMTESEGKRNAVSPKDCKGYTGLARRTAQALRDRLREHCKNTDIFNTDFNIAGGCLHFRTIYDTAGMHNVLLTIELYNTGVFGYYTMGKRAPNHVKRFSISRTYYGYEFNRYLRSGK